MPTITVRLRQQVNWNDASMRVFGSFPSKTPNSSGLSGKRTYIKNADAGLATWLVATCVEACYHTGKYERGTKSD